MITGSTLRRGVRRPNLRRRRPSLSYYIPPALSLSLTTFISSWSHHVAEAVCSSLPFFIYFLKHFFIEIYFWFHNLQFYTPTARQEGGRGPTACLRGPAAPLPGGRGLYVIKILWRPLPPGRGAAVSPQYKSWAPPPAFAANNIHRGKNERRGVMEGVITAKTCRILDPNRR